MGIDVINKVFGLVMEQFTLTRGNLSGATTSLLSSFVALEILTISSFAILSGGYRIVPLMRALILALLAGLAMSNFEIIQNNLLAASVELADRALGPTTFGIEFTSPGVIINHGLLTAKEVLLTLEDNDSWIGINLTIIFNTGLALLTVLLFGLVTLAVIAVRLDYAFFSTIAFILLPLAAFSYTRDKAAWGIVMMYRSTIILFAVLVSLSISVPLITAIRLPKDWVLVDLIVQLMLAGLLLVIVHRSYSTAKSFISGVPALSGSEVMNGVISGARTVASPALSVAAIASAGGTAAAMGVTAGNSLGAIASSTATSIIGETGRQVLKNTKDFAGTAGFHPDYRNPIHRSLATDGYKSPERRKREAKLKEKEDSNEAA
jgi:hypothetical protein